MSRRAKKRKPRKKLKPRSCNVCQRLLTDERSIRMGVGPTCLARYQGGLQKELERFGQLRLFD